jgi:hypothetical protein
VIVTVQCNRCHFKYPVRVKDEKEIQFQVCSQCGSPMHKYVSPREKQPLEHFKEGKKTWPPTPRGKSESDPKASG